MPRPRFQKLSPERQTAILDAAAEEFAAQGFEAASFNHIIEQAGISKGSMYYYFDDKQDLYLTVLARLAERFMAHIGLMHLTEDVEEFWDKAEVMAMRSMEYYAEDPTAAGLMRSLLMAQLSDTGRGPMKRMREAVEVYWRHMLRAGQKCGALRDDVPGDLMLRLAMGICDAVEMWCAEKIDQLSRNDLREIAVLLTNSLRQIGQASAADEDRRHLWQRFTRLPGKPD